jgi:hypothetical protein
MSPSRSPLPIPLKQLLDFPLHSRRDLGQLLLTGILITGLQIAFFPLAFVLDAGYSLQVARPILFSGGGPALPSELDWSVIFRDGLRRCGLWLIFLLPGVCLGMLVVLIAGLFVWQAGLAEENIPWLYALLVLGLSFSLLFCLVGAEFANVAAIHSLAAGTFAAAFQFRAWFPVLRVRLVAFELIEVVAFFASLLLALTVLVMALPAAFLCIGPPILLVTGGQYLHLVSTAATALLYRDALPLAQPRPAQVL